MIEPMTASPLRIAVGDSEVHTMSKQAKRKVASKPKAPVWRTDRITKDVDENTGRRVVDLPTIPGLTDGERDAIFAFEAGTVGTVKATIRMNKRLAGTLDTLVTHKIAVALAALDANDPLRAHYA